jgi:spore coat protein CotH
MGPDAAGADGSAEDAPDHRDGEIGGQDGPGDGGSGADLPSVPVPIGPPVAISEIMYHPVLEDSLEDEHEFVEIFNTTDQPITLTGWKLLIDGQERFIFPANSSLAPKKYLVIAKNKQKLLSLTGYGLAEEVVVGDYSGELANGGSTVVIIDGKGQPVDHVKYSDRFPWPIGADGLGAGERWLPQLAPFKDHQYRGRSLERISFEIPASEIANWDASPVDQATPGKARAGNPEVLPIVEVLSATPQGVGGLIRNEHAVVVSARFSTRGTVSLARVEHFVQEVIKPDGERVTTEMIPVEGTRAFQAVLPAQKDNVIVRYRILADRGAGLEVVSPRPSDPFAWHAYFVTPGNLPAQRTYQLLIAPENWTRMWSNLYFMTAEGLQPGPNAGCQVNPTWNDRVPAVFIFEGRVYDVRVRYQGSRSHRRLGKSIESWTAPGPSSPTPLRALSWSLAFPRYARMQGRETLTLNKLYQACPGVDSVLESRLLWAAGVPTTKHSFVRVHINGAYYHYMMDTEKVDERTVKTFEGAGMPVGDLFKSDGAAGDEGPWGRGDFRRLSSHCNFSPVTRYATTYERHTHKWKGEPGHTELIKLVEELHSAVARGPQAVREYFTTHFEIENLLDQFVIRNWSGVWDDSYHNFFPYKRPNGKWIVLPQDFDLDFGGAEGPSWKTDWAWADQTPDAVGSFYIGEEGNPNNKLGFSHLKSQFIKSFRSEFNARLLELSNTVLSPVNVLKIIDEAEKEFSVEDWDKSPAAEACDIKIRIENLRDWARKRHEFLISTIR